MKNMLETQFPGINVILANYPPPLPKRLLSKLVPIVQFGMIGIIVAGEQIFPRLGFAVPPSWYYSLRANKFGSMASTWLLGNFVQSFLQSSGAFEVYCNDELVMFISLSEITSFNSFDLFLFFVFANIFLHIRTDFLLWKCVIYWETVLTVVALPFCLSFV